MRRLLASLCFVSALPCLLPGAAVAAEVAAMDQKDMDAEFQAMIVPASGFLELVNTKFAGRECVRDRSHLNDKFEAIELSLYRMFVVRDDLRKDLRELAMRLATFQPLPSDVRHLAIPLVAAPQTKSEKTVHDMVVQARTALWAKLDELDAKYPATATSAPAGQLGLIITIEDRGWRPGAPTHFRHETQNCRSA